MSNRAYLEAESRKIISAADRHHQELAEIAFNILVPEFELRGEMRGRELRDALLDAFLLAREEFTFRELLWGFSGLEHVLFDRMIDFRRASEFAALDELKQISALVDRSRGAHPVIPAIAAGCEASSRLRVSGLARSVGAELGPLDRAVLYVEPLLRHFACLTQPESEVQV
jgi:hypothetical protein